MPFPMQVILLVGATGYLLTALLFFITRSMPRIEPGAGWWGVSSLAAGSGYIALLALGMQGRPELGEAVYNSLFVVWVSALYIGGSQFLGRPLRLKPLLAAAGAVILWLSYFNFVEPAFLPAAVVVALYCGLLNLRLAWLFFSSKTHGGMLNTALAGALAVSGLHWLDYPLLRPVESFAPIGFSLCAIVSVVINGLLAGLVIRQFRRRMLKSEQEAIEIASHDPLTGLNNRMSLESKFEQVLAMAHRNNTRLALLYMDLDGFKPVNDRQGHKAGDEVLTVVARRIESVARHSDIVARIGGDEFVLVLTDLGEGHDEVIEQIAAKVVEAIRQPMVIDGVKVAISGSVGVAMAPTQADDLSQLLNLADKAMYETKRKGKDGYTYSAA